MNIGNQRLSAAGWSDAGDYHYRHLYQQTGFTAEIRRGPHGSINVHYASSI